MIFQGKTVFISGGASGIGYLCGKRFAEQGANIVLTDIEAETLEKSAVSIRESGGKVLPVLCDCRYFEQIEAAKEAAISAFGSLDILIPCAGGASFRVHRIKEEFKNCPVEILDWGIDVNLKGPLYLTRAVIGQMARQKSGVIIYLGSITGEEGGGGNSADYAAAKSGVMYGLTKSMAQYGAQYGIRAVCVSPGPVLTRTAMADMKTLLGRAAEPEEIVDLILYLASDKAAFITGVNYLIDGGRRCMIQ